MPETQEYKDFSKNIQLVNFLEISENDLVDLRTEVIAAEGKIEIYVHPFFYTNHLGTLNSHERYPAAKKVESRILETIALKKDGPNKVPFIIFEEEGLNTQLTTHLHDVTGRLNFIPTKRSRAQPVGTQGENATEKLLKKLEQVGVKEIKLAGSELIKKTKNGLPDFQGCVGEALKILQTKFKVTISEDLTFTTTRPEPQFRYPAEF